MSEAVPLRGRRMEPDAIGAGEGFAIIAHPADIGVRFWAPTLAGAYRQAARGLTALLAGNAPIRPTQEVTFGAIGRDRLDLLVAWLDEILFRFDAEQLLLGDFTIHAISDQAIRATATGEPFDASRHETPYYVKAVTYHQIALERGKDGWHGQVFFDI